MNVWSLSFGKIYYRIRTRYNSTTKHTIQKIKMEYENLLSNVCSLLFLELEPLYLLHHVVLCITCLRQIFILIYHVNKKYSNFVFMLADVLTAVNTASSRNMT